MPTGVYIRTEYHRNIQKKNIVERRKSGEVVGFLKGQVSFNKGKKMPEHLRIKQIGNKYGLGNKSRLGQHWKMTDEQKKAISERMKGNKNGWIEDRSLLKKENRRGDPAQREWRLQVYKRDNYKCRINNCDCSGRIEAHHILGWTKHPELRYEVNNGITLCHFHHPRKRVEEIKLTQTFIGLIMQKELI